MTDTELLHLFITEDSNAAFTQLTTRHAGLVYAAALRQTRSTALASDITQAVFLDLARHARKLRPDTHLPSWLITVTRRTAIDAIRRESRQRAREQTSAELATVNAHDSPNASTSDLAPILDDALTALPEPDRRAVLLRFFENQSFQQIARHLGATEASVQKRVTRALEKLRTQLARRGIATSAALLAAQLPLHASTTVPATLATTLAAPAFLATAATLTTTAATFTQTLLMTATHKTVITTALVLSLAAVTYQAHQLASQSARLKTAESALIAARTEIASLQIRLTSAPPSSAETTSNTPVSAAEQRLRTLLDRVEKLKTVFELTPDEKIPELAYLTENDWIRTAMERSLESPGDFESAQASLRSTAKYNFAPRIQLALRKYLTASGGQLPDSITQLQPFFESAVDPAILARYEMSATGPATALGPQDIVIVEKPLAFADSPVDRLLKIAPRYVTSADMPEVARKQAIFESRPGIPLPDYLQIAHSEALTAYRAAHNGDLSSGFDSLRPYFKNPEHAEKVFRFFTGRDPETGQPRNAKSK